MYAIRSYYDFPFAKAGIYSSSGVRRYWMITAFLVILFPVGFISWVLLSNHELTQKYSLIALGLAGLGFFGPYFWLKNKIIKRKNVLMKAFPEAMDILVVCVEAGMGRITSYNVCYTKLLRPVMLTSPSPYAKDLSLMETGTIPVTWAG